MHYFGTVTLDIFSESITTVFGFIFFKQVCSHAGAEIPSQMTQHVLFKPSGKLVHCCVLLHRYTILKTYFWKCFFF